MSGSQVLRLERQVLKRRVKRDFIELRSDIQPQQPQLHLANRSQLRHSSAGSSSAQLLALGINRPANQVPARGKPQQQHSNAQSVPFEGHTSAGGGFHVATNNNNNRPNQQANGHVRPPNQQPIYAGGRYPQAHHQAGLARLGAGRLSSIPGDMISLGSTLQPELLLASDSIASVISSQHRPANNMIPNPMLYTTTTTESVSQVNNGSSMRPVNGSISSSKRAPFNDPSWPQMWYLVSISPLLSSPLFSLLSSRFTLLAPHTSSDIVIMSRETQSEMRMSDKSNSKLFPFSSSYLACMFNC